MHVTRVVSVGAGTITPNIGVKSVSAYLVPGLAWSGLSVACLTIRHCQEERKVGIGNPIVAEGVGRGGARKRLKLVLRTKLLAGKSQNMLTFASILIYIIFSDARSYRTIPRMLTRSVARVPHVVWLSASSCCPCRMQRHWHDPYQRCRDPSPCRA